MLKKRWTLLRAMLKEATVEDLIVIGFDRTGWKRKWTVEQRCQGAEKLCYMIDLVLGS